MGVVAMLNHETAAKLRQMKLSGMAESYERQMAEPSVHGLSFDERLGLMVDQEWLRRQNSKMAMLLKKAGFVDSSAAIEDIDYAPDRRLDRPLILELAGGNYISHARNIIITGPTCFWQNKNQPEGVRTKSWTIKDRSKHHVLF